MTTDDLDAVVEIERGAFPSSWRWGDFLNCLRNSRCETRVAERGSRVMGFVVWEIRDGGLHIMNLAVAVDQRRQGIGTQLVHHVARLIDPSRCRYVYLEVRETNLLAQLFYRHLGFEARRVMHTFYPDTTEDGYLMEYWPPE